MQPLEEFITETGIAKDVASIDVIRHSGVKRKWAGVARRVFPDLALMTVGPENGPDSGRNTYQWWPLYISDRVVAELRNDAEGISIHIGGNGPPDARRSVPSTAL